ncbi:MAG: hypothetical protein CMJ83_18085 [Planctomycetes bacterium]|nr:hypothetical protein [Planctomycetota bacterium]
MELAELIFSEVRTAGFDEVGCLPIDDGGDPRYAEWIARGYHGEMGYLERHAAAKQAPAAAFAEFRTIVVCALEYGDVAATPERPSTGNLSRYALGDDYHDVMKKRLFAAADRLRNAVPDLATRAFVDTGPLNEKLIAAAAGLGWVGKHTNLIDPGRGSYFFLGCCWSLPSCRPPAPRCPIAAGRVTPASPPVRPARSSPPTSSTRGAASRT